MALCVISAVLLVYGVFYGYANPVTMVGTGYEGITVTIDPTVPAENCGIILANFEVSFWKNFLKKVCEGFKCYRADTGYFVLVRNIVHYFFAQLKILWFPKFGIK